MYIEWYNGTYDVFGIEHRQRREEMEETFNKEAKQGWRFAADAARFIHLRECKHRGLQAHVGWSPIGDWLWTDGVVVDTERRSRHAFFFDMKDDSLKHGYLSDED